MRAARFVAVATLGIVAACGHGVREPASRRVGKALAAMFDSADQRREPWRCAALDLPELADETLPQWQLAGHAITRTKEGDLAIGIIADAGGSFPRTIAALTRLRTKLEAARIGLVVTLGGMGSTQAELEGTLGTLADHAPWPVISLAGDLEPEPAQIAAIAALRKRGDVVVDGRLARWIELPGATIGTIPGAGAAARLIAHSDGCSWRRDDVSKIFAQLATRPGLRIAAMAEAPRQLVAGDPAGELALVPEQAIDLVLHGPLLGAPSHAQSGSRDGRRMLLSPGTSDATTRLSAPSRAAAGILTIRGSAWTWTPIFDEV